MNCPECGGGIVLGGPSHARCREAQKERIARMDRFEEELRAMKHRLEQDGRIIQALSDDLEEAWSRISRLESRP